MKVLIGDISSYKAIVVAKFLKQNYPDCYIIGFDSKKFTQKIHSKYFDESVVMQKLDYSSMKHQIEKHAVDVFLPVINDSLDHFWRHKENLGNSISYLGDYDTYQLLNDKDRLAVLATELGIEVPKVYDSLESAEFPLVIKPKNLSSAKGVIYLKSKEELPQGMVIDDLLIQQFVQGQGVGYSFYAKNGKIINGYGHLRLSEFPASGGSSTYRRPYSDERMRRAAERIMKHLNYSGFAMFEFKLTPENELLLLEVNPRIWGSIHQGLANGNNYFESIFGKGKAVFSSKRERFTYVSPLLYLSWIQYMSKGNFKPIFVFLRNLGRNRADVLFWRDPKGYLSTIVRKFA